jgi:hypothetical protein
MPKHKVKAVINEDLTKERPSLNDFAFASFFAFACYLHNRFTHNSLKNYEGNMIKAIEATTYLMYYIPLRVLSNGIADKKINTLVKKS